MEKSGFCLAFLLCVASTSAFWQLNRIPDFVKSVVRSEPPKYILKQLWNSNQAQLAEGRTNKGEAQFLENILRFGTLRKSSSPTDDEGHATNCGQLN